MRLYEYDFLTKPRWYTNQSRADKSFFFWKKERNTAKYSLNIMGILNAFLIIFHIVLVVEIDDKTNHIVKYRLRKKWF